MEQQGEQVFKTHFEGSQVARRLEDVRYTDAVGDMKEPDDRVFRQVNFLQTTVAQREDIQRLRGRMGYMSA